MRTVDKVWVTGDFLRMGVNGGPSQSGNIRWLFHLINPALELLTTLKVFPLCFEDNSQCIGRRIFQANLLESNFNGWIKIYAKDPTARELAIIEDKFSDSFVIAFELPELVRKAFDYLEIPYVDFTIHPARFLDDILFGVRSNLLGLGGALSSWIVSDEEIQIGAGIAMASLSKLPALVSCKGNRDIALFAGQTSDDKVLIHNGKLMQTDDFMDQFSAISSQHSKVLVKPHPYAKQNPVILALTRLLPNTELVESNFYHLLAQPEVTHVYSLTSSTSIEAGHFGKSGRHLARYPYAFSDSNAANGHFLTIRPELFNPMFWYATMSLMDVHLNKIRPISFPSERSRMRKSLRNFWGADIFDTGI
jgi:hypothetical protein